MQGAPPVEPPELPPPLVVVGPLPPLVLPEVEPVDLPWDVPVVPDRAVVLALAPELVPSVELGLDAPLALPLLVGRPALPVDEVELAVMGALTE